MKFIYWALGIITGIVLLFGVIQTLASERIEVVELTTLNEVGEEQVTRLWVVDGDGFQYLRVGADGSGLFSRLQDNGEIQVTRKEEPKYLSWTSISGLENRGEYVLEPQDGKTKVIFLMEYHLPSRIIEHALHAIIDKLIEERLAEILTNIKKEIEAKRE